MKLAEQHGYIVVSPLGFTPLGAYGNPLRLPAVFGQPAAAASQRAAVTPARQRELNLSELEVMTALEIVTEEYRADRARHATPTLRGEALEQHDVAVPFTDRGEDRTTVRRP